MASVRARITTAYGAAMLGAVAAFAVVVTVQRRASTLERLTEEARATASLVGSIIQRQVFGVAVDTLAGPRPIFTRSVTSLLDALPGYIIVAGDSSTPVYWSRSVRRLDELAAASVTTQDTTTPIAGTAVSLTLARDAARKDLDALTRAAYSIPAPGVPHRVRLSTDDVLLVASLHEPPIAGGVRRIVVGASTGRVSDETTELAGLTVVFAPLLVLLATFTAWWVAGRALEPVDRIVNDVAAITDGRSLHRRVVLESDARDEFGRLGHTVNEMIGRLESSFGALRRFTADASHELRTPLTVIRADVERAMNTPHNSHEQAVALEEALQQVSRMASLVESLLTLARADEGRLDIVREPVPLEPLIREVAETAGILGEVQGITVRTPLVEPATVLGDAERLRQLLLNLATNAVKYTPRGGSVEISLESRHDEAIVTVKDDGIGIAAADLPFIFDRFWRVDRARTRAEGGGTGLGLSICHWIAQAHDGRIDVASRLGRGSTFTVVLPVAPRAVETPNTALSKS